uniref:TF-B3 domain-containing protein n=1 Tax=Nelumbo nucifera TaxID=4432 RepID=A0A822Z8Q4_NELNU|nr:TPA_asm: hypothetical protein HUJ06_015560 [Nelumbo nucifera]
MNIMEAIITIFSWQPSCQGLSVQFCKMNLPKRDETIILEDENGEEHPTTFLAQKTGLSAGWRGFAISHELVDGDALVFQLVKRTTFKVLVCLLSLFGILD